MLIVIYLLYVKLSETIHINRLLGGRHLFLLNKAEKSQFLYSKNRLNVAISRAQCLAVVVANPKLLEIPCGTVEQMKLVNTFCWLDEYADKGTKTIMNKDALDDV
ncbi:hypothetical protein [Kiloniella sp.]|uniref:hypothetical protein n=1 Tax=Kiloniella sp. TaxID=1938587 RepID=UPI003B017FBA